jgi:glycosyltransferase involved in cell wall biosynthesis
MKLVINAFSARLGGGQTYLHNLLQHLPARPDLEVLIYAPESLQWPAHPKLRRMSSIWPTTNPLLRTLWERMVLPRVLRQERAQLLFCPGGVVATRAPAGCKVVTMFRNMHPFDTALVASMPWSLQRLRLLTLRRVLLRSMAQADLTIFISNHARGVIEALVRVPHPVTIPHGISPAFRSQGQLLPRPSAMVGGDYLLYVSRLDSYKHHRQVVQAFATLPAALRQGLRLVFLGETDLPEAGPVQALVRERGLQDRVLMPGAVPYAELPAWYQHARAIVFASSCENCPNILLESLGAGRPVLCSDVMPMPEFGGPGLSYFSPFDPASLTQALQAVLQQPEHASQIARAALERSKAYDWAHSAAQTWQQLFAVGSPTPEEMA